MKRLLATFVVLGALATAAVAQAANPRFDATLSGAQEVPPVATEGTGTATFTSHGDRVSFKLRWNDLTSPARAAHIHCAAPGVNGPVGVTLFASAMGASGHVNGSFTGPDAGNGCGWQDLDDVLEAMASGATYVNVHTQLFPGGEIRGQIAAR